MSVNFINAKAETSCSHSESLFKNMGSTIISSSTEFHFPEISFLTGFPEMLTQQPKKPQNFPIGNVFINEKTFKKLIKNRF